MIIIYILPIAVLVRDWLKLTFKCFNVPRRKVLHEVLSKIVQQMQINNLFLEYLHFRQISFID